MFDATKEDLIKVLESAASGEIQLPEFQRDYVWGDDDIRSLLASVAQGFPIGAILTLETGGSVEFKPRPLEGLEADPSNLNYYLLDGQQRITSLGQALFSEQPINTITKKGKKVQRYYYLDIQKAVDLDEMEDAIIGVPKDRVLKTNFGKDIALDLSSTEQEYELNMFPLNKTFDNKRWLSDWRHWHKENDDDVDELERSFDRGVLNRFERYEVPIIQLKKENGRAAICQVFEKVNVGGKKLDAFELVTAIYAGDNFDLREDWLGSEEAGPGRRDRMIGENSTGNVLKEIASTDFLQACTILSTREKRLAKQSSGVDLADLPAISCRRDALLQLEVDSYKVSSDAVEQGFLKASRFLNERKIISHKDVPYPPQIVTLGSVFALLENEAENDTAKSKLDRWFWCTTFGELYGSSTESRIAFDVPELIEWVRDENKLPRSIEQAVFQKQRLNSLRTRVSAAYKGIHAQLMHQGCLDFVSGRPVDIATFFDDRLDIHHIFPQAWCKKNSIEDKVYNSIVNKTPLSRRTNQRIGGRPPSEYLKSIEKKDNISPDRLDEILHTHLIDPQTLRDDDFEGFYQKRADALAEQIGSAMGKTVVDSVNSDEVETDVSYEEEMILA